MEAGEADVEGIVVALQLMGNKDTSRNNLISTNIVMTFLMMCLVFARKYVYLSGQQSKQQW